MSKSEIKKFPKIDQLEAAYSKYSRIVEGRKAAMEFAIYHKKRGESMETVQMFGRFAQAPSSPAEKIIIDKFQSLQKEFAEWFRAEPQPKEEGNE